MWKSIRKLCSSDKNVLKYVFEKSDAVAESVLYKYPDYETRTVVCCSTQSGCPIGCRFCGTGDYFVRNLSADEIVEQTTSMFSDQNIDVSNVQRMQIMFMSMGEPLLNRKPLVEAIRRLHTLYPNASLLISTSGPDVDYEEIMNISKEIDKVGLQFSVHESTDEARDKLIPFKAKLNLKQIAECGEKWYATTGRKPFFNYCAHDKNTTKNDADRILSIFNPNVWEATISVVCERDEHVAAANERQRALATGFRHELGKRGFSTRIFDPAGQDDVGGGCGQLWHVQNWMQKNPTLAKVSIGKRLPVLHAPKENNIK